jgi:hypothetical protein
MQRNKPVSIWGFGAPSTALWVQLNKLSVKAAVEGDRWYASFPAQKESDPKFERIPARSWKEIT